MQIPDQESRGHITPTKTYLVIAAALFALTAITVGASLVDWGAKFGGGMVINIIIAMVIATTKALLVMFYFMHMKYEGKLVWGYGIFYPLVLFSILMFFLVIDVFKRNVPKGMNDKVQKIELHQKKATAARF